MATYDRAPRPNKSMQLAALRAAPAIMRLKLARSGTPPARPAFAAYPQPSYPVREWRRRSSGRPYVSADRSAM